MFRRWGMARSSALLHHARASWIHCAMLAPPNSPHIQEVAMKTRNRVSIAILTSLMAAIVVPASASISYTPVNSVVPNNGAYRIDFNHDGIKDFWIGSFFGGMLCGDRAGAHGSANVSPVNSGSGVILNDSFAAALPTGSPVGPTQSFVQRQTQLMFFNFGFCGGGSAGNWLDVSNQYLGLEFQIAGQTHYGWAELSVIKTGPPGIGLITTVVGFAYETEPDTEIITGQTGVPNPCAPPSTDQTIHICTPAAGATVPASVVVSAQARWDSAIIYSMQIYVDNVRLYNISLPPAGTIEETPSLDTGIHHLVIMAWDTHGHYILSGETFTTQ